MESQITKAREYIKETRKERQVTTLELIIKFGIGKEEAERLLG